MRVEVADKIGQQKMCFYFFVILDFSGGFKSLRFPIHTRSMEALNA